MKNLGKITAPLDIATKEYVDGVADDKVDTVNGKTVLTSVPANAVFTDTVTPVVNNLTSTSTTSPLSAAMGKSLQDNKVDKVSGKELSTNDLTDALKNNYDAAYSHSTSSHAPTDAERNTIVGVQKNGTDVSINSTTRKVNITVPTKVSELTNDSGFKTTDNNTTYTLTKTGNTITLTGSDNSTTSVTDSDTDTHYESKNVVGSSTAKTNTTTALTNGNVYLNSVENNAVTSSHKISGSGATTVTTDTRGNIVITSTDTDTKYTHPTSHPASMITGLSTVATSGKYSDLSGQPTIPTKTSQLTNDSGYKTTDNNTTYTLSKTGSTIKLTGSDGSSTTVTDSDTDTVYTHPETHPASMITGTLPVANGGTGASSALDARTNLGAMSKTATYLSTSILAEALKLGDGEVKNFCLNGRSYTGGDLPSGSYNYGMATAFRRGASSIFVVLWGYHTNPIQMNTYDGAWRGWQQCYGMASSAAQARINLGALGEDTTTNTSYPGLMHSDGTVDNYIRTPKQGLLPYESSTSGSGYVGTPVWPFLYGYFKNLYADGNTVIHSGQLSWKKVAVSFSSNGGSTACNGVTTGSAIIAQRTPATGSGGNFGDVGAAWCESAGTVKLGSGVNATLSGSIPVSIWWSK